MAQSTDRPTLAARLHIDRRRIQIALGIVWIVAGALQLQPGMFSKRFVSTILDPAAGGQPSPIASLIHSVATLFMHAPALFNLLFALTQLSIGAGLLFRRTAKVATVVSVSWALGVWFVGEGLGGILTNTESPLMGAPGAVLMYGFIGILVWPRRDEVAPAAQGIAATSGAGEVREPTGIASSAVARGVLGYPAGLVVWAAYWVGSAVIWMLPANRQSGAINGQITAMSSGNPAWFEHPVTSIAGAVVHWGSSAAVVLAGISIIVGVGPLLARRYSGYLAVGAALSAIYWIIGQALGGILTGMGTDMNIGPLVVLLAVALLPTRAEPVTAEDGVPAPTPIAASLARRPFFATLSAFAVILGPVAVATMPAGASVAAGMKNMSGMTAGHVHLAADRGAVTAGKSSSSTTSSSGGMDMAAMPGMPGHSDAGWTYSGPALPAAEARLLTKVSAETDTGHAMQTPSCTTAPTDAQMIAATQLVQKTSAAVAKYRDLSAAEAAGYGPITNPDYPVVHYVNLSYMSPQYVLDPNHVQSLVYAMTPHGPVLVAAMYLMPSTGENGPMPGGCLTQWHAHTNLCMSESTYQLDGFTPCAPGSFNYVTPNMTHIWQVPVPGGPLAMDPSDLQVVEAAVMAQQQGLAPVGAATPWPTNFATLASATANPGF